MEVRLHDDATGGPRPFALQLQRRAGKLGVLLTAADGAGERYMLSDAVSGVELSEDDFIGRVRACEEAPSSSSTGSVQLTSLPCCGSCAAAYASLRAEQSRAWPAHRVTTTR